MVDGAAQESGERGLPFLLAPEQSKERKRESERERYIYIYIHTYIYYKTPRCAETALVKTAAGSIYGRSATGCAFFNRPGVGSAIAEGYRLRPSQRPKGIIDSRTLSSKVRRMGP